MTYVKSHISWNICRQCVNRSAHRHDSYTQSWSDETRDQVRTVWRPTVLEARLRKMGFSTCPASGPRPLNVLTTPGTSLHPFLQPPRFFSPPPHLCKVYLLKRDATGVRCNWWAAQICNRWSEPRAHHDWRPALRDQRTRDWSGPETSA